MTPLGWILFLLPFVAFLLKGTIQPETNESFIRQQWEQNNRWFRNGKLTLEEFQWCVEMDRDFIGEEEWNYWMKKIRREKYLLYGKVESRP